MKIKSKLFLSAAILTPLFVFAPITAIADDNTATAQNTNEVQLMNTADDTADKTEKLRQRLEKRKTDLKTRLTFGQQTRLKARCEASQTNLGKVSGRINGLETSRTKVYDNLTNRLTSLSGKLKQKGLDTVALEAQIAQLQALITTFNTDLQAYKQAVGDLTEMDCVADAVGFQASLEAARTARAKTFEDAKAIRAYLADTVKATLQSLKSQLDNTESQDQDNGRE